MVTSTVAASVAVGSLIVGVLLSLLHGRGERRWLTARLGLKRAETESLAHRLQAAHDRIDELQNAAVKGE